MTDPTPTQPAEAPPARLSAENEQWLRSRMAAIMGNSSPKWRQDYVVRDLLAEVDALRAERDEARAALAEIVAWTTTRSGTTRPMVAKGKGRAFAAAVLQAKEMLAASNLEMSDDR